MKSLRIARRRATKLTCIVVVSVSCAVGSLDGLKARPLEYESVQGGWTNDGTPFEEPELKSETTYLHRLRDGSTYDGDGSAVTTGAVEPRASATKTAPLWIRVSSLLFRLGWIR